MDRLPRISKQSALRCWKKLPFLSLAIVKTVALFFALFYLSGAPFIRWNFTSGLIKATDSVNREREEK